MNKMLSLSVGAMLLVAPLAVLAAETVPDAGIRAEMAGQWDEAVGVYRKSLDNNPAQAHLWVRIANIRARQKNFTAARDALNEAIRYAPRDPVPYAKLSEVHAVLNEPQQALAAINRAVELEPKNIQFLKVRGVQGAWNKDYQTASDSFSRVLALDPKDSEAKLGLARATVQLGNKDRGVKEYQAYLAGNPQDRVALMEYIELEAARANLPGVRQYGKLYRERFGEDMNYWLRMADNYALAGDDRASADAIQQATRLAPNDHALFYRLAQSYPSVEDVRPAMAAIERAVALEPKNIEYLRARADLAAWGGDYATAIDSNKRILQIAPEDPGALLGIARVLSWQGETDASAEHYQAYLAKYPQVQAAWIEYIKVETERGDYALAMELLEHYRGQFGENAAYQKQKARILAQAERPSPSLSIVSALDPVMPNDYELGYTRTIALAAAHRPREALDSLAELEKQDPKSKETADLRRYIRTPLRSNLAVSLGYQRSSDNIRVRRAGVEGEYVINPETRLFGGVDKLWLSTIPGSAFTKLNGTSNLGYRRIWGGIRHRVSSQVSLDAQIGQGNADGKSNAIYEVGADLQPADEFNMRLSRRQDLFAVSPRAADLGIQRRANTLAWSWQPNLRYTVDGQFSFDSFSDGNARWEADLAPRRAFVRSQRWNLDLGVGLRTFGFSKDPGNGYYAPRMYERYSLNAYAYRKIDDDNGISISASVGPWKDNTMTTYRLGDDVAIEGYFGLYRDWMLNVRAVFSHYGGEAAGGYRSSAYSAVLTKRF